MMYNMLVLSNFNLEEVLEDEKYISNFFMYITKNDYGHIIQEGDKEANYSPSEVVILNMGKDDAEKILHSYRYPAYEFLCNKSVSFFENDDQFQDILGMSERWTGYKTLMRVHT